MTTQQEFSDMVFTCKTADTYAATGFKLGTLLKLADVRGISCKAALLYCVLFEPILPQCSSWTVGGSWSIKWKTSLVHFLMIQLITLLLPDSSWTFC